MVKASDIISKNVTLTITIVWLLPWSSGQSSWPQMQRFQVRFPALPHFF
jgi:hypothetical protein